MPCVKCGAVEFALEANPDYHGTIGDKLMTPSLAIRRAGSHGDSSSRMPTRADANVGAVVSNSMDPANQIASPSEVCQHQIAPSP